MEIFMNTLNTIILTLFVLFTDHTMSESSLRTATHKGLSLKEVYRPDKKGPWPEFLVEVSINAEPLESVAIYYALDYQQNYVPGVIKSVVTNQPGPLEAITDYEFETPWPLPNSIYTNGSKLEQIGPNHFKVNWWMIKNNSADETTGYAEFIPAKNNTTKLVYRSYVSPKNFLATFFKGRAKEDIKNTIIAIKLHIEMLKKDNSPLLKKYVQIIKDSLSNKYTYVPKKK